jgi:hypothetical protein
VAFSLLPARASYHQKTKIPTVQFRDTRSKAVKVCPENATVTSVRPSF